MQSTPIKYTPSQKKAMTLRGRDLLISAAAGSGKTKVLIERIILRLLDPEDAISLSDLLVVTFTRNATAELKNRISKALGEELAKRPNEKLSSELLKLGSAQISTIDSFFQKLVREHFDSLEIPRTFRMVSKEELAPLSERVMKETLEAFYSADKTAKKEFFQSILQNRFAGSMDHLLNVKKELELRSALLDLEEKFHKLPGGLTLLRESADRLEQEAALPYFSTRGGKKLKNYTKERFERFTKYLGAYVDAPTCPGEEKVKTLALEDLLFCRRVHEALDHGYDNVKAALSSFEKGVFPRLKEKSNETIAYQSFRDSFKKTLEDEFQKLYSSFEIDIQNEMRESADFARSLYGCLSDFSERMLAEKKARGTFTFDDVANFAYDLLTKHPEISAELSEHYKEVYVDEYQDVNRLQDDVFRIIGQGHRFMVGDIKQSIYRFRGGEPEVFSEYRKAMPLYSDPTAENASGVSVFMSENFRCDPPIIDATNRVCSFLFSRASDEMDYRKEDDLVFKKKESREGDFAKVKVALFGAETGTEVKQEENFVADEIASLIAHGVTADGKKIAPGDIAVLVRKNDQASPFEAALRKRGIPVCVEGEGEAFVPPELIDLMNLLEVIDNPHRDLPLLEFLQSPMGGFSLEELVLVQSKIDKGTHSLFDALEQYREENELAERIAKMLAFLEECRRLSFSLPVDQFLQKLYETDPLQALANSDIPVYLYDQARQYSAGNYTGLYDFLTYFEKRCNDGKLPKNLFLSEENAVRILTIHKSKGEEYPVVFVTSLAGGFPEKELQAPILLSKQIGFSAKLYNPSTLLTSSTTDHEIAKLLLRQEMREEQIRLLYVAMTRARERLYLTGSIPGAKTIDTFQKEAESIKNAGRHEILAASSPMTWIFATLEDAPNAPWELTVYDAGTYESKLEATDFDRTDAKVEPKELPPDIDRYAKILEKQKDFLSDRALLQKLPSKIAASKIAPDLFDRILDENEETSLETKLELLHSASSFSGFLSELKKPSATDIGSAMHAFLQFCDFHALAKNGPKKEAERLIKEGFLPVEAGSLLRADDLQKFTNSALFAKILSAKAFRREQQFARLVPMKELTQTPAIQDALGEKTIFVQGSIDLILENDEGLMLIDYKTDRIEIGETFEAFRRRLLDRHGSQLKTYANAMEQLFGAFPISICLYSLPLGKTIEFSMEELKKA